MECPFDGVVGGGAGVGQRPGYDGVEGVETHKFPRRGHEHVTGQAPIDAVATSDQRVVTVVVLTAGAPEAVAARVRADDRHRVADGETRGAGAEFGNVSADLVAEGERDPPPERFHECSRGERHADIGMAQSVACDPYEDLPRSGSRNRHLCQFRRVLPFHDAVGLHHLRHRAILTWTAICRPRMTERPLAGQDVTVRYKEERVSEVPTIEQANTMWQLGEARAAATPDVVALIERSPSHSCVTRPSGSPQDSMSSECDTDHVSPGNSRRGSRPW